MQDDRTVLLDDYAFVEGVDCSDLSASPPHVGDIRLVVNDEAGAATALSWKPGTVFTGGRALG